MKTSALRANITKRGTLLLAALLAILPTAACTREETPPPPPPQVELVVGVAASLRDVLEEGIAEFRQSLPRVRVTPSIGATGALVEQARAGAPIDLLLLADPARTVQLVSEGLVDPADVRSLAGNSLVAVVPSDSELYLRTLDDLLEPAAARIAIGAPDVAPVGAHARRVLQDADLWEALGDRLVYADNARHALDLAARGEVDVAFVYTTDALAAEDAVRIALTFPIEGRPYEVALLRRARAADRFPASAQALFEYLAGEAFQRKLAERGFKVD